MALIDSLLNLVNKQPKDPDAPKPPVGSRSEREAKIKDKAGLVINIFALLLAVNTYIGGSGAGLAINVVTVANAGGTSWLGDNYDPVLLYGSMREAMLFMKGEQDLVSYYEQKYQEALQQLNRLGTGLERGDAYRDGQARIGQVNP